MKKAECKICTSKTLEVGEPALGEKHLKCDPKRCNVTLYSYVKPLLGNELILWGRRRLDAKIL